MVGNAVQEVEGVTLVEIFGMILGIEISVAGLIAIIGLLKTLIDDFRY